MIRLSGLRPYEDIEIVFTGLRPGEKLFEELLIAGEGVKATRHEKIRVLQATSLAEDFLRQETDALLAGTRALDVEKVLRILKELVPEFQDNGEATTQEFISQGGFQPEIANLDLVGKKNLP